MINIYVGSSMNKKSVDKHSLYRRAKKTHNLLIKTDVCYVNKVNRIYIHICNVFDDIYLHIMSTLMHIRELFYKNQQSLTTFSKIQWYYYCIGVSQSRIKFKCFQLTI